MKCGRNGAQARANASVIHEEAVTKSCRRRVLTFFRTLGWYDSLGALRLALPKRNILARKFVQRNQDVIGRQSSSSRNTRVDVFQKGKPRFLGSTLNKDKIENDRGAALAFGTLPTKKASARSKTSPASPTEPN
jgi:hypothetical protein